MSGVLGASTWVVWIHEKIQLDPLRLVRVRPINLVQLLHIGNKRHEVGGSQAQKEAKQRRIWKIYAWPLSGLKLFNRSLIKVINVERRFASYNLF
jgi:hypothetical protein